MLFLRNQQVTVIPALKKLSLLVRPPVCVGSHSCWKSCLYGHPVRSNVWACMCVRTRCSDMDHLADHVPVDKVGNRNSPTSSWKLAAVVKKETFSKFSLWLYAQFEVHGALPDVQEVISFILLSLHALLVLSVENCCMKKHLLNAILLLCWEEIHSPVRRQRFNSVTDGNCHYRETPSTQNPMKCTDRFKVDSPTTSVECPHQSL
ncbi:uncharacterized protein LOC118165125 [Oxyura jamaicensis]|uniref:uncharacterized protein LOC118165125 n=1 Tax=Oxyura jamaicensis TaxID=8884 RepID=UPI0015A6A0D8|nr:uncharacterized protein LOC118165125 [Oxyura jamaicensis]